MSDFYLAFEQIKEKRLQFDPFIEQLKYNLNKELKYKFSKIPIPGYKKCDLPCCTFSRRASGLVCPNEKLYEKKQIKPSYISNISNLQF